MATIYDPLLDFVAPTGWPTPSLDWVASNQGWEPPQGWTPVPDIPAASAGWAFWVPNKSVWPIVTATGRRHSHVQAAIAGALFALGIALTVSSVLASVAQGSPTTIAWVPIVAGAFGLIRYPIQLRRITRIVLAGAVRSAPYVKTTRDQAAYQRYLTTFWDEPIAVSGSSATLPRQRPMDFEDYLARRSGESWSFPPEGVARGARPARNGRMLTSLLREPFAMTLAAVGVLGIAAVLAGWAYIAAEGQYFVT